MTGCSNEILDKLYEAYCIAYERGEAYSVRRLISIFKRMGVIRAEKILDKSAKIDTIKSTGNHTDGGPGSGHHGHKGVKGQRGGSAPSNTSVNGGDIIEEEATVELVQISASGANAPCKGFEHRGTAKWKIKKHGGPYANMTVEEYEKHAIDLLKRACDDRIDGYQDHEGAICRFDRETGEYAKGFPGSHIKTCFYPGLKRKTGEVDLQKSIAYFERHKEDEAIEE